MRKLVLAFACISISFSSFAQMTVTEKNYDISRKARKGYLGQIVKNEEKGTFDLIYILKSTNKKVITETYTYDKDLNLLNTVKDEDEIEKLRKKYKWFRYKGETYETQSVYVRANMMTEMVFRQKTIQYKWSWWRGGYARKIKLGEKVKPVDEETNNKYSFVGGFYENDPAGYMLVLGGTRASKGSAPIHDYKILQADKDAKLTVSDEIKFSNYNIPVFSNPLEDNNPTSPDDYPRDWILLFAPGKLSKKEESSNKNEYTYCRISPEGKILERTSFTVPVIGWRLLGAYEKDGEVYFYGPGIDKKGKYFVEVLGPTLANTSNDEVEEDNAGNGGLLGGFSKMKGIVSGESFQISQESLDKTMDEKKYSNFQVGKISAGKISFVTAPGIGEINDKNVKPEGQKKKKEFDGKRFLTTGISVTEDKNVFVSGQDYSRGTYRANNKIIGGGAKKLGPPEFQDMFMLQYDANGNFLRNYGVEVDQKKRASFWSGGPSPNVYPAISTIVESGGKKMLHWIMKICRGFDTDTDIEDSYNFANGTTTRTITNNYTPLYTIQYGTINKNEGTASDFKTLGEDQKRSFFLMNGYNNVRLGNFMIYLSETKKGDKLLLSRFDVSN